MADFGQEFQIENGLSFPSRYVPAAMVQPDS